MQNMEAFWLLKNFFRFFFLILIGIAVYTLWFQEERHAEVQTPPPPVVEPTLELVEEGDTVIASPMQPVQGSAELVSYTKAVAVKNPHSFPIHIVDIVNTYEVDGSDYLSPNEMFGYPHKNIIAPGETVYFADFEYAVPLSFGEDLKGSELEFSFKQDEGYVDYHDLTVLNEQFITSDGGDILSRDVTIKASIQNTLGESVNTERLGITAVFFDQEGKIIGGDSGYPAGINRRIQPGEQAEIELDGYLITPEFEERIKDIKVFVGCSVCK